MNGGKYLSELSTSNIQYSSNDAEYHLANLFYRAPLGLEDKELLYGLVNAAPHTSCAISHIGRSEDTYRSSTHLIFNVMLG